MPVPPRPRLTKDRSENEDRMSNPGERERESREAERTKYEELGERESEERKEAAEKVQERLPVKDSESD